MSGKGNYMERLKTKTGYILICSLIAAMAVMIWHLVLGTKNLSHILLWMFYSVMLTALPIFILYPRNAPPTAKRMRIIGVLLPCIVMAGLSVIWAIYNPHFPNGDPGVGYNLKPTASEILELALGFFIFSHMVTVGLPYLISIYIALHFVDRRPSEITPPQ